MYAEMINYKKMIQCVAGGFAYRLVVHVGATLRSIFVSRMHILKLFINES